MATQEVSFAAPADLHDILVAELSECGFGAFETRGNVMHAFAQVSEPEPELSRRVQSTLSRYGLGDGVTTVVHPHRNWNAEWESTVQPVAAGPFIVAPSWVDVDAHGAILLRIDPKMSFGTGHHPSTRLALQLLADCLRNGDRVLDAGTGTGVLAIASVKLGAARALGFDIDPTVYENFDENARRNGVEDRVDFVRGTIADVREDGFDLVVANISRNVLLETLPDVKRKVRVGGRIILAGLLTADRDIMCETAGRMGMLVHSEASEGDWWACAIEKRGPDDLG